MSETMIHSDSKIMHRRQPVFGRIRHVHMVGIGGIGMSSIAEVLLRRGYEVSGSDLNESAVTRHLEETGARVFIGHRAGQEKGACVVVHSSDFHLIQPLEEK